MSYLAPDFSYDVFVSYSHGNPRGNEAPLRDWTRAFVDKLEAQIFSLDQEFDDLNVWMDAQIDPTAHLTDGLRNNVDSSGILMIMMSKRYLGSAWCSDELNWFKAQVHNREAEQGRVFVIRIQRTEEKSWPEFLRDGRGYALPGFTFFDPDDDLPLGWPGIDTRDATFAKEFRRLQTALKRRLREMRERAESRRHAAEPHVVPVLGPSYTIYLHAVADHDAERNAVRLELIGEGVQTRTIGPTVGNDLGGWLTDSGNRRAMAMNCEALVLLRADVDDRFVGDLLDIGIYEREQIAASRGLPMPCAVIDRTGKPMPPGAARFNIKHFDATHEGWCLAFREWLEALRKEAAVASR